MGIKIKRYFWRSLFSSYKSSPAKTNILKSACLIFLAAVLSIPVGLWRIVEQSPSVSADAPVISSISPDSGSIDGGDTVTINGSGFTADPVTKIAGNQRHSCAIVDTKAYCWGYNDRGQLGDGSNEDSLVPVAVDTSGVLANKSITDITIGSSHTCAVADSQAYCWGANDFNELGNGTSGPGTDSNIPVAVDTSGVLGDQTVTSISSRSYSTCLMAGGAIYCWGANGSGQLGDGSTTDRNTPVAVDTDGALSGLTIETVVIGTSHACTIASGAAYCWGDNDAGQLGDSSTIDRHTPVLVNTTSDLGSQTVTDIDTSGGAHTCAIADSSAYCWGANWAGQLGTGNNTNSNVPVEVDTSGVLDGKTMTDIGTGGNGTCVTASDQTYCWGANHIGQLGNGTSGPGTDSNIPVAVDTSGVLSGKIVTNVYPGGGVRYVVADGSAYSWGQGNIGNDTIFNTSTPVAVNKSTMQPNPEVEFGGSSATDVAVLDDSTITAKTPASAAGVVDVTVTKPNDTPFTLSDSFTYLGPPPVISSVTPNTGTGGDNVTITGLNFDGQSPTFDLLSEGSAASHSCGITSDSSLYCWGNNAYGQLGDGSQDEKTRPHAVETSGVLAGKNIIEIATSHSHSCALDSNGAVYCWGNNEFGQLGDGSQDSASTPVSVNTSGVLGGKTITKITAGADFTCALDSSGKAYCWGKNTNGQLGMGALSANSTVPVEVDSSGVVNGKTLTSITSGVYSTCALDTSGQAYCWGGNDFGMLGNESADTFSTSPVEVTLDGKTLSSISSGFVHVCALDTAGDTYCWGRNDYGQLGDGTTNDSSTPVAVNTSGELSGKAISTVTAGGNNSCAIDSGGNAYCWGYNVEGQIGNDSTATAWLPTAVSIDGILASKSIDIMSVEGSHICALDDDGRAYCWGSGSDGQLGNNTNASSHVPVMTDTSSIAPLPDILFGTEPATNIVMVNSTTLTATVPSHTAGPVDITVENPDGQSTTLADAYTYQIVTTAPGVPTSLSATPASNQVDLSWTAPSNNGNSPITDYKIEYSTDGVIWQEYAHTASTDTNISVSGITPGVTYQFRVSAINAIGYGGPSNVVSAATSHITLSAPTSVGISVTPAGSSTVSSTSSSVNVTTNNPDGYDLMLESSTSNRNLTNGSNSLTPVGGTLLDPTTIGINTWGYRVDGAGGFTGATIAESNVSASVFNWAGVPESGNPDIIKSTTEPATNDETEVWYAMRIDNNHPAGTYTNTVLYTAVAG